VSENEALALTTNNPARQMSIESPAGSAERCFQPRLLSPMYSRPRQ